MIPSDIFCRSVGSGRPQRAASCAVVKTFVYIVLLLSLFLWLTAIFGAVDTVHTVSSRLGIRSRPRRSEEVEPIGSYFSISPNWTSVALISRQRPSECAKCGIACPTLSSAGANLGNLINVGEEGGG